MLLLSLLLAVHSGAVVAPGTDAAIGNLLDAAASGAPAFDGSRVQGAATAVPASPAKRASALSRPSIAPAPTAPTEFLKAPAAAEPRTLGLYSEDEFEITTGRCVGCNAPVEGRWYFLDEVIAVPKAGKPALVWLGAHELVEGAVLSADGASVRLQDGTVMPFELVPKIASNRSYYDQTSLAYFKDRTLRMRGEFVERDGVKTFVARTIWPEDYRIDASHLEEATAVDAKGIDDMVGADKGGAQGPFQAKLLWERTVAWERTRGPRLWEGKPVMGFMVNGAQGDDDEALAGHFSMFTGRYGAGGSMADWMFNNFYDMNTTSEKGIVASLVPMDKYMTDLNSGQSWYRPSAMIVMVMKDARLPNQVQEMFKQRYSDYYSQKVKYDHTHLNCTALISDPVRGEGWNFPENGKTPTLVAKMVAGLAGKFGGERAGKEIFDALREEPTRSFPRAAFSTAAGDLMSLVGEVGAEPIGRELTPFEKQMQEDLVAILWVRLPQLPSSRKFGRDAVGGVMDYIVRTKGKVKETVPTQPRPFPPPH